MILMDVLPQFVIVTNVLTNLNKSFKHHSIYKSYECMAANICISFLYHDYQLFEGICSSRLAASSSSLRNQKSAYVTRTLIPNMQST